MAQIECPQCGTEYQICFPESGAFIAVLDMCERLIDDKIVPYGLLGLGVGSAYWVCVTFGAVTIMQAVGHDRGLILMERAGKFRVILMLGGDIISPL